MKTEQKYLHFERNSSSHNPTLTTMNMEFAIQNMREKLKDLLNQQRYGNDVMQNAMVLFPDSPVTWEILSFLRNF